MQRCTMSFRMAHMSKATGIKCYDAMRGKVKGQTSNSRIRSQRRLGAHVNSRVSSCLDAINIFPTLHPKKIPFINKHAIGICYNR